MVVSTLERSEYKDLFLGERSLRVLPGQYFDVETDKHYNYFRDYDPRIGRYIQSDPIGLLGGTNTFGYVLGNPLRWFDRLGLCISGEPCPGVGQIDIPNVPYSQPQCIAKCVLEIIAFGGSPKPGPNDVLRSIGHAGYAAASAVGTRFNIVVSMVQIGGCNEKCPSPPPGIPPSPGRSPLSCYPD